MIKPTVAVAGTALVKRCCAVVNADTVHMISLKPQTHDQHMLANICWSCVRGFTHNPGVAAVFIRSNVV